MYDLNTLVGDRKGLLITNAVAINAKGWIAAYGTRDGKKRGVLLIPQPAQ
jgi:hypothetical protein